MECPSRFLSARISPACTLVFPEVTKAGVGVAGEYDSKIQQKPILGFVFGKTGLLGDLSLEGAKITRLVR